MATTIDYSQLESEYAKNKSTVEISDTAFSIESAQITVPPVKVVVLPMDDLEYASGVSAKALDTDPFTELGLKKLDTGVVNDSNDPTLLLSAKRLIINSEKYPTMIFGDSGIALSSPDKINLDSDDTITIFADKNLYLGVPNRGLPQTANPVKAVKLSDGKNSKANPTTDYDYEPLVLGTKLENILEDLIQILKNAVILSPVGPSYLREDTQYDLLCLQNRLKEMISTYAFVDGKSHEQVDTSKIPSPPAVTVVNTTLDVSVGLNTEDTTSDNTQEPVQTPLQSAPNFYQAPDVTVTKTGDKFNITKPQ